MSKIYCGNGTEKRFDNGGSIIQVTLDVDALAKNFNKHGFTTKKGKRMIKVKVCRVRETDQYGNTHYVEIDTWKPNQGGAPSPQQQGGSGGQDSQDFRGDGNQARPLVQGPPPTNFEDDIPW